MVEKGTEVLNGREWAIEKQSQKKGVKDTVSTNKAR